MTPTRFADCLRALHWSQRGFADVIGYDDRLIRRWAAGDRPIPDHIAAWLERAAAWHAKNPPPSGNTR